MSKAYSTQIISLAKRIPVGLPCFVYDITMEERVLEKREENQTCHLQAQKKYEENQKKTEKHKEYLNKKKKKYE